MTLMQILISLENTGILMFYRRKFISVSLVLLTKKAYI